MGRITNRDWRAGDPLPNESVLAEEFGCARATVNRAMRDIASAGFIVRRRKGGSHVALTPVRKAVLSIPVTRMEIEKSGATWRHHLLHCRLENLPAGLCEKLKVPSRTKMLHVKSVHFADERPFVFEDRWINPAVVPQVNDTDFESESANEWLVRNAPYSHGDYLLSASIPDREECTLLAVDANTAILVAVRTTWLEERPITTVRLAYAPGHIIQLQL